MQNRLMFNLALFVITSLSVSFGVIVSPAAMASSQCLFDSGSISPGEIWEPDMSEPGRIDRESVNVRSGPGTQFQVVGNISSGSVIITGYALDNNCQDTWYRVRLADGSLGWIRQDLITFLGPGRGLYWF